MSGEELRALAEAATPGPWVQEGANYGRPSRNVRAQHQGGWPMEGVAYNMARTADAAFIAAANPTAVLALLDERDALRAQVERVRALAETLGVATEGPLRVGTALWPECDRDAYSLAIEEAQTAIRAALDPE